LIFTGTDNTDLLSTENMDFPNINQHVEIPHSTTIQPSMNLVQIEELERMLMTTPSPEQGQNTPEPRTNETAKTPESRMDEAIVQSLFIHFQGLLQGTKPLVAPTRFEAIMNAQQSVMMQNAALLTTIEWVKNAVIEIRDELRTSIATTANNQSRDDPSRGI
jgi:hypothetical protein